MDTPESSETQSGIGCAAGHSKTNRTLVGLNDHYLEKDLEDAILLEIEHFLLELGAGFTFKARQKRLEIDHDDFYIDLLSYNRKLKRLVAIDLKLGSFK